MKTLIQIINESKIEDIQRAKEQEGFNFFAGGKCGWFATAESCISALDTPAGQRFKQKYFLKNGVDEEEIEKLIKQAYDIASKRQKGKPLQWYSSPLVFGKDYVMGIRRIYPEILDLFEQNVTYSRGAKFELHNGFGAGTVALDYEKKIVENLIILINGLVQEKSISYNKVSRGRCKEIFGENWRELENLYPIYYSGDLDSIISDVIKNPQIDLSEHITLTGKKSVYRNKNGQVFDSKTFEVKDSDLKEVLIESGEIIADITITPLSGKEVYISVKEEKSQLSAVVASCVFLKNSDFIKGQLNNTPYKFVEFTSGMVPFKNFCKIFGIKPDDLYNKYLVGYTGEIQTNGGDKKNLNTLIQKLIGGNYWYVKHNSPSVFVPYDKKFNFNIEVTKVDIKSSQYIVIYITIDNTPYYIKFRTAGDRQSGGKERYPYRIFPYIDVNKLVNSI